MDMTKAWTAQHGWIYLHAIVDCCTREIAGWSLDLRCRDDEAIEVVEQAVIRRGVGPGVLTLGTDNGSQFTSRDFRKHLSARGISHRRGGYRDPESHAFIEKLARQQPARAGSLDVLAPDGLFIPSARESLSAHPNT